MISSDRIILKDNPNEINIINDIISQNFACGPSMISIIDEFGNLFLYNEYQKLYKLKIERSISHVKFLDHNFYAISKKKEFPPKSGKACKKTSSPFLIQDRCHLRSSLIACLFSKPFSCH